MDVHIIEVVMTTKLLVTGVLLTLNWFGVASGATGKSSNIQKTPEGRLLYWSQKANLNLLLSLLSSLHLWLCTVTAGCLQGGLCTLMDHLKKFDIFLKPGEESSLPWCKSQLSKYWHWVGMTSVSCLGRCKTYITEPCHFADFVLA